MTPLDAESLESQCHVQMSWTKQKVINLVDRHEEKHLSCLYNQTSILPHWSSSSSHPFRRIHVNESQNPFFTFWPLRNCQRCPPDFRSEFFRFYSCHFKQKNISTTSNEISVGQTVVSSTFCEYALPSLTMSPLSWLLDLDSLRNPPAKYSSCKKHLYVHVFYYGQSCINDNWFKSMLSVTENMHKIWLGSSFELQLLFHMSPPEVVVREKNNMMNHLSEYLCFNKSELEIKHSTIRSLYDVIPRFFFLCNDCHMKLLRCDMSKSWWLLEYGHIDKTYLHCPWLHFTFATWYVRS